MVWVVTGIVLGVCALAAVGVLGLRVWCELRGLVKEVGRASAVLTESAGQVQEQLARTQSAVQGRDESLSAVR
jgi:predicted thioredoxin/glutaredoxin